MSSRPSYNIGHILNFVEEACHQLDLSANLQGSDCGPSYERYSTALSKLTNIKDERLQLQIELNMLKQIVAFTAASAANPAHNLASRVTSEIICTILHHMLNECSKRGRLDRREKTISLSRNSPVCLPTIPGYYLSISTDLLEHSR